MAVFRSPVTRLIGKNLWLSNGPTRKTSPEQKPKIRKTRKTPEHLQFNAVIVGDQILFRPDNRQ